MCRRVVLHYSNAVILSVDNETIVIFKKSVSLESLNLGPRTAGDGADDEESLTGTITSGECIWQDNYEDDGDASRCGVSEKHAMEKQENPAEIHANPEKKDESVTEGNNVKVFEKSLAFSSWIGGMC
ncbi:unnamed protein product [Onchocerca flexuosa]|uniref:Uncharacterized protein n=1 Tax=Onchocerca flexuosa TaxID=387005 RepID=A0A3P8FQA2_9BILA|nr:unnamed protein product [Onchocerca flexuosa]